MKNKNQAPVLETGKNIIKDEEGKYLCAVCRTPQTKESLEVNKACPCCGTSFAR